ncbi:hypothetical protein [Fusobacterium sp. SYSU M8D902]|uniref:hypothetical protein n=1 Tax=Fusobacterium sp. SYSU M8D902 TaxID=3159562 RepID=UPI0032E518EA
MENNFWKEWIKLVLMLLGILGIWVAFIFICDKYFGKTFEDMRFIHYFIFMVLIMKAKDIFLKNIGRDGNKENDKKERE